MLLLLMTNNAILTICWNKSEAFFCVNITSISAKSKDV